MAIGGGTQAQIGFRIRDDTFPEATDSGWLAPLNTNWLAKDPDLATNFRVRFIIEYQSSTRDLPTGFFYLYYSHNGGIWTRITRTSNLLRSVLSNVSGYNHGDDTTQLIGTGASYKVNNNQVVVNADWSSSFTWLKADGAPQEAEVEWVLEFISEELVREDTLTLKINRSGVNFSGGHDYYPVISIQKRRILIS